LIQAGRKWGQSEESCPVLSKSLFAAVLLMGAAAAPLAAQAAAIPSHSFALDGSLSDSIGGATLSQIGGSLGASGFAFGRGEGLSLTGAFASPDVYSVEMFFRFDSLPLAYARVLNSSDTDNGLYIHDTGGPKVDYYQPGSNAGAAFSLGQMHHLVFTRDTGSANVYLDGGAALTVAAFGSSQVNGGLKFFIDELTENAPGYIDFIQTYDRVLTGAEAATLYNNGAPDPYAGGGGGAVPEPSAWALMILGFGAVGTAMRRRRVAAA